MCVVVEELIPEMLSGEHSNIGVVMFSVGFTLMMALDVALGHQEKSSRTNGSIYIGFSFKGPSFDTSFCENKYESFTCFEHFLQKASIDS